MKKIITESLIKWAFFSIWATFTIFWVYAATNLISVQSVNNQTVLTSNLWNETMSSLTWAINELKTNSVNLDWVQTITWTKTFSTQVAWVNPTANNHLATKIYVDSAVSAASAGWTSWVTKVNTCTYRTPNSACVPDSCASWWTDLWLNGAYAISRSADSTRLFMQNYRTCAIKM